MLFLSFLFLVVVAMTAMVFFVMAFVMF